MDYKELFDKIKNMTTGQVLVKGFGTLILNDNGKYIFDNFSCDDIYESTGNFDEELMVESFSDESEFTVGCEGEYTFEALFSYSAEEHDCYPPIVSVPAYYDLLHIEFKLEISKEELKKIQNDTNEPIDFCF